MAYVTLLHLVLPAESTVHMSGHWTAAKDRSLIVADPRRCEPKKFGGAVHATERVQVVRGVCVACAALTRFNKRWQAARPAPASRNPTGEGRLPMAHGAKQQKKERKSTTWHGRAVSVVSLLTCRGAVVGVGMTSPR